MRKIRQSGKLVEGVGINDADYSVIPTVMGKRITCPFYKVWKSMLVRCYSKKYQQRQPTYMGCTVSEEWLTFSEFKSWMGQQDWIGKQLDKDLLYLGNKQYNKNSCIFISKNLNCLLTDATLSRGIYPLGVHFQKQNGKFQSNIRIMGRHTYLGIYTTPQAAHAAWQVAKKELIYNAAMEQSDERLKGALLSRCTRLQFDIDNGLETFKL